MKNEIIFRIIKKIKTYNISNNIIKETYKQYLSYKYLEKKYKKIIDNSHYKEMQKQETKIIWVCWFQGIENAPEIVKVCIERLKQTFINYEIIIITEENFKEYVKIPEYIIEMWKEGKIGYAHFSDILRLFLLCEIGGIWIDSTVYTTAKTMPNYLEQNPFFVFQEINLNRNDKQLVVASNWFIKSNAKNPILLLTRDLLCEYWKKTNVAIDYYIFHLFFKMATEKYPEIWKQVPIYNNVNPHIMQFELFEKYDKQRFAYYANISDFHKLTYKFKGNKIAKNSNVAHILGDKK